ncbi:Uncharacterised protein [Serratia fonticola]|nr:Uncharacterised protein [Serratia fonticola]
MKSKKPAEAGFSKNMVHPGGLFSASASPVGPLQCNVILPSATFHIVSIYELAFAIGTL